MDGSRLPPRRLTAVLALALATVQTPSAATPPPLAPLLSQTGLYSDLRSGRLAPGVLGFTPQYPLWSDGSLKQRWIRWPPGPRLDASDPNAWQFPPGTRLWKEFSMGGRVETRLIERLDDGSWRYATYVWRADGSDAVLAPEGGIAAHPVAAAPAGRYRILAQADCRACHEAAAVPVLGVAALQLSTDRDPGAANALPPRPGDVDLRTLQMQGWLQGLDPALLSSPPRIAARTPTERAALGYLHGNCGHCHNRNGAEPRLPLELALAQPARGATPAADVVEALLRTSLRYRRPGSERLVVPGDPSHSVLVQRTEATDPNIRMPPLGTVVPDPAGTALLARWIRELPRPTADKGDAR
jgi:hypothetical protein